MQLSINNGKKANFNFWILLYFPISLLQEVCINFELILIYWLVLNDQAKHANKICLISELRGVYHFMKNR